MATFEPEMSHKKYTCFGLLHVFVQLQRGLFKGSKLIKKRNQHNSFLFVVNFLSLLLFNIKEIACLS